MLPWYLITTFDPNHIKMKKASVLFLAMAAVGLTAVSCSSNEETEEETVEKVVYTIDASASTLKWHGEENENHFHDGVIQVTEGTLTMEGDKFVSGEFTIDPKTIKGQTEGYPQEKMDYLSMHLQDTAFLFVAEYPTIKVTADSYENGNLSATINVRGVDLKAVMPVAIKTTEDGATMTGEFTVNFSPVGMPYLEMKNEEGQPAAKSGIEFKMDLKLNKK